MPHQCLKCGKVFEENSSQLLKGCPNCGGTRFFFTKEPLSEEERKDIAAKVDEDIKEKIIKLIGVKTELKFFDKKESKQLAKIKAKDVRETIESLTEKPIEGKTEKIHEENIESLIEDENARKALIEKLTSTNKNADYPETIRVKEPGDYEIDLQGLLHEEPIIIHKNGVYTIHLPSAFEYIKKEKNFR
jgi:hypothetical protein